MASKPSKAGRKGKYCPEIVREICKYIEEGMSEADSMTLARISHDTFYRWKREKTEFADAIKEATSKNKQFHINILRKAAPKSWQASAWWMERKFKDEYAKREERTGSKGGPIDFKDTSTEELIKRLND